MVFVTDPDDLDRYQILFDPNQETIGIKGLGAARHAVRTDGDTTDTSNDVFSSAGAAFDGADAVAPGDILVIATGVGGIINHYVVAAVISSTILQIDTSGTNPSFPAQLTGLTYRIFQPTAADGPNGGNVGDGVTMQALYSFAKEEWKTLSVAQMDDLVQFRFPIVSITREQFEIGDASPVRAANWDFRDDDTRNLIRTGGWAVIDSAGVTQQMYAGIITLGSLDANTQVYYLQGSQEGRVPQKFVLPGAVNQAIKIFDNTTSDDDFRTFLQLFARKKGKTYAGSEISDIGVSTLETIVNRFPLTHGDDPAIVRTDGEISGADTTATDPFQQMTTVATGDTDGVVADADTTDGVFELTSAGSTFQTDGLRPKDTAELTSGSDQGVYEIVSVDSETALTLKQEPNTTTTGGEFVAIVGGSSIAFTTRTRVRSAQQTDGQISPLSDDTATFSSAASTFVTDSVSVGDIVLVTAGEATVIGAYKVVSADSETVLTIDVTDQIPSGNFTGLTFEVLLPGMHLQRKSVVATQVTDLQFISGSPAVIQRNDSGDFIADGYTHAMAVTVAGSTSNDGTFIVNTVTSDQLVLIAAEVLTNETAPAATLDGEVGFVRTLNAVDYPFNWRLFGNSGTLAQCFQFIQKELRRGRGSGETGLDIDAASPVQRGDTADLLMSFASPNGTTLNLIIDDINSSDINNATYNDISGDGRQEAFTAGVNIALNDNIKDDIPANGGSNKVAVFFTTNPGGDFGTPSAILVDDASGVDMLFTDRSTDISTTFDYDNNSQGGRTPGTDAGVTIVAIGLTTAQYAQVTGTIQRISSNSFSLVAALERNYANP